MIGRGCFTKLVLILILLVGTGYYMVNKYGGSIWNNVKSNLINYIHNDVEDKIKDLIAEATTAELEEIIGSYTEKLKSMEFNEAYDDAASFFGDLKSFLEDNKLNEHELFELKKYLEK